jgi:hypothetical protein
MAYAVLLRFGYLAFLTGLLFVVLMTSAPLTTDLSAWYAPSTLAAGLTLAGLAAFGALTSLGGRSLFQVRIFPD